MCLKFRCMKNIIAETMVAIYKAFNPDSKTKMLSLHVLFPPLLDLISFWCFLFERASVEIQFHSSFSVPNVRKIPDRLHPLLRLEGKQNEHLKRVEGWV